MENTQTNSKYKCFKTKFVGYNSITEKCNLITHCRNGVYGQIKVPNTLRYYYKNNQVVISDYYVGYDIIIFYEMSDKYTNVKYIKILEKGVS